MSSPEPSNVAPVEAPAETPINFDELGVEAAQYYIEHGELPPSTDSAKPEEPEPSSQPADEPEPAKGEAEPPKEEIPEPFKFTENADLETFTKERDAYLETVEITPELQYILDAQNKQLEESRNAAPVEPVEPTPLDEMTGRFVDALNQLARFKLDPETRAMVPDTSKMVEVLQQDFPNELEHLIVDLNTLPSKRLPGKTVYQEFLAVMGDLDEEGLRNVQTLLDNGGRFQSPTFVPQGIDPKTAEAYWSSPHRATIDASLQAYIELVNDPSADAGEKAIAQNNIAAWLQQLTRDQHSLDVEKRERDQQQQTAQQNQETLSNKTMEAYYGTTNELARQFQEKLVPSLSMFDETGANLTAISITALVETALGDDNYSAQRAQSDLAKQGVKFDWKKGRAVLDELWQTEYGIQQQTAIGQNPRAIELSKQTKDRILRELRALETDLLGQITKKTVTGAAKALQQKVQKAPRVIAVRSKAPAVATTPVDQAGQIDFTKMSLEEQRSRLGELRRERMEAGLPV